MSRSPSKKIWRKAAWLLKSGRVAVHAVGPYGIHATVEGEHDTYEVTYAQGEWECECPYRDFYPERPCAHIAACWLVWNAVKQGERDDGRDQG